MSVLKFAFNVIRNLCLIFVLALLALAFYFDQNPQKADAFFSSIEEPPTSYGSSNFSALPEPNQIYSVRPVVPQSGKIPIGIKGGTAYVRPAQVMYVDAGVLTSSNNSEIEIAAPLYALYDDLKEKGSAPFFKTKNSIINCLFVERLISERNDYQGKYNYEHYAVMENQKRIKISEKAKKELKRLLDDLAI